MQDELCDVLPLYRDAVSRLGSEAFKERIFGQDEIDEICQSFRHLYDELPVGQEPPANCVAPAAPDWEADGKESRPNTGVRKLQRALTDAELNHMATGRGLCDAPRLRRCWERLPAMTRTDVVERPRPLDGVSKP